jgi:CheY-like chemotaxis protein
MIEAVATPRVEKKGDRLSLMTPVKSLLVIEDDLSMIQFLGSVISDHFHGLEWEYVTSGEAALELIRRRAAYRGDSPYSLIVTDIFLEGETTGFDVWLECQDLYPEMPFVVTSHLSFDRYFSIIRGAANCPVYLPKPLTVGGCQSVFEDYF